jgi:hypothetical protein
MKRDTATQPVFVKAFHPEEIRVFVVAGGIAGNLTHTTVGGVAQAISQGPVRVGKTDQVPCAQINFGGCPFIGRLHFVGGGHTSCYELLVLLWRGK